MSIVLITGASRGIGTATAKAFAAQGHRVAINYRSDEAGAQIADAIIFLASDAAHVNLTLHRVSHPQQRQ